MSSLHHQYVRHDGAADPDRDQQGAGRRRRTASPPACASPRAADNAAYWSIATTMRSDNKALSTVQDALGLGAATVDVAYTGARTARSTSSTRSRPSWSPPASPASTAPRSRPKSAQLQKQLKSIADSPSFSAARTGCRSIRAPPATTRPSRIVVVLLALRRARSASAPSTSTSTSIKLFDANAHRVRHSRQGPHGRPTARPPRVVDARHLRR